MKVETRYLDGSYLEHNPNWDREDAEWKALQIKKMLNKHEVNPNSIVEVGCGAGDILRNLRYFYTEAKLFGYDISPQVQKFWTASIEAEKDAAISFNLGDFHLLNNQYFDLLLMIDVFEHVRDPFTFLEESHKHAKQFIFHIPLDLSASSITRAQPLINTRRSVGHLHSYTKDLALETLTDCGYNIIDWYYTGASLNRKNCSLRTRLARIPRHLANYLNKDLAVRVLGGETILVLAK